MMRGSRAQRALGTESPAGKRPLLALASFTGVIILEAHFYLFLLSPFAGVLVFCNLIDQHWSLKRMPCIERPTFFRVRSRRMHRLHHGPRLFWQCHKPHGWRRADSARDVSEDECHLFGDFS